MNFARFFSSNPPAAAITRPPVRTGGNYGTETVESVQYDSSVTLNGTTVKGHVDAGSSLNATDASCASASSGMSCEFIRSTCSGLLNSGSSLTLESSEVWQAVSSMSTTMNKTSIGSIDSGSSLEATNCAEIGQAKSSMSMELTNCPKVGSVDSGSSLDATHCTEIGQAKSSMSMTLRNVKIGSVDSGSSLDATNCSQIGSAKSSMSMTLTNCQKVERVDCGFNLSLVNSNVLRDATCSSGIKCTESTVKGCLTYSSSEDITLTRSEIGSIVVKPSSSCSGGMSIQMGGGNIFSGGHSIVQINGQTWINGVLQGSRQQTEEKKTEEKQRLILVDTIVLGDIEFLSGQGEVIQEGSTQICGEIKGLFKAPTSLLIPGEDLLRLDSPAQGEEASCTICLENKAIIAFNCGHKCTCVACSKTLCTQENPKCPQCRTIISSFLHVW